MGTLLCMVKEFPSFERDRELTLHLKSASWSRPPVAHYTIVSHDKFIYLIS